MVSRCSDVISEAISLNYFCKVWKNKGSTSQELKVWHEMNLDYNWNSATYSVALENNLALLNLRLFLYVMNKRYLLYKGDARI